LQGKVVRYDGKIGRHCSAFSTQNCTKYAKIVFEICIQLKHY